MDFPNLIIDVYGFSSWKSGISMGFRCLMKPDGARLQSEMVILGLLGRSCCRVG